MYNEGSISISKNKYHYNMGVMENMWKKLKGIDIALYIFILTGLGHLVTFLYEWGYKKYFGISMDFIELSVSTITKSITMVGIFIGIGLFANIFFEDSSDLKKLFKVFQFKGYKLKNKFFYQFLCILGMAVMLFGIYETNSPLNIAYYVGVLVFVNFYASLKEYKQLVVISFLFIMLLFPYMIGVINASQKDIFYQIGGTNQIIIEISGDKAIAAKFDSKKKVIFPEYEIIKIDSTIKQKVTLKLVQINNLKVLKGKALN
jgi:hypothetical protein